MAGRVPGHSKAGEQVDESAEIVVERPPQYVSRGGEKLAHALDDELCSLVHLLPSLLVPRHEPGHDERLGLRPALGEAALDE